jgi:hypothetical protein
MSGRDRADELRKLRLGKYESDDDRPVEVSAEKVECSVEEDSRLLARADELRKVDRLDEDQSSKSSSSISGMGECDRSDESRENGLGSGCAVTVVRRYADPLGVELGAGLRVLLKWYRAEACLTPSV